MAGCQNSAASKIPPDRAAKYCQCMLSYLEANVSEENFVAMEKRMSAGEAAPDWLLQAARACVSG